MYTLQATGRPLKSQFCIFLPQKVIYNETFISPEPPVVQRCLTPQNDGNMHFSIGVSIYVYPSGIWKAPKNRNFAFFTLKKPFLMKISYLLNVSYKDV